MIGRSVAFQVAQAMIEKMAAFDAPALIEGETGRGLDNLVEAREFRIDLFYRLKLLHLTLPPLRERYGAAEMLAEQRRRPSWKLLPRWLGGGTDSSRWSVCRVGDHRSSCNGWPSRLEGNSEEAASCGVHCFETS